MSIRGEIRGRCLGYHLVGEPYYLIYEILLLDTPLGTEATGLRRRNPLPWYIIILEMSDEQSCSYTCNTCYKTYYCYNYYHITSPLYITVVG